MDHNAEIDALVTERHRRHNAAVEQACEAALQGGEFGVRVWWDAERTVAEVDPSVPYGQVHEHPFGYWPTTVTPPVGGTP